MMNKDKAQEILTILREGETAMPEYEDAIEWLKDACRTILQGNDDIEVYVQAINGLTNQIVLYRQQLEELKQINMDIKSNHEFLSSKKFADKEYK